MWNNWIINTCFSQQKEIKASNNLVVRNKIFYKIVFCRVQFWFERTITLITFNFPAILGIKKLKYLQYQNSSRIKKNNVFVYFLQIFRHCFFWHLIKIVFFSQLKANGTHKEKGKIFWLLNFDVQLEPSQNGRFMTEGSLVINQAIRRLFIINLESCYSP